MSHNQEPDNLMMHYESERQEEAEGREWPEDETGLCACGHEEELHRQRYPHECLVTRCPCEKFIQS